MLTGRLCRKSSRNVPARKWKSAKSSKGIVEARGLIDGEQEVEYRGTSLTQTNPGVRQTIM